MSDSFYRFFPTLEDDGSETQSVISKKIWEMEADEHSPLLRLLTIAKSVNCSILPLAWGSAMDLLGEGATGKISQAPLNSQISFAYKRFSHRLGAESNLTHEKGINILYNSMVCEMVAFHLPEIYRHPNIAKVEGLCFELVPESDKVWPVLVFRKAVLGSLDHFIDGLENALELADLVDACGEIAKGLRVLHISGEHSFHSVGITSFSGALGVVHGDIKPQNVLVFRSIGDDATGIEITDFGYAGLTDRDNDLVKLPQSRPWDAPEYSPRWLTTESAKRTDVYSFGLLVFWLLFREETLFQNGETEVKVDDAFRAGSHFLSETLESMKQSDALLKRVLQLVSESSALNENLRERLGRVFALSLCCEPGNRASDMRPFVELCCEKEVLESVTLVVPAI